MSYIWKKPFSLDMLIDAHVSLSIWLIHFFKCNTHEQYFCQAFWYSIVSLSSNFFTHCNMNINNYMNHLWSILKIKILKMKIHFLLSSLIVILNRNENYCRNNQNPDFFVEISETSFLTFSRFGTIVSTVKQVLEIQNQFYTIPLP